MPAGRRPADGACRLSPRPPVAGGTAAGVDQLNRPPQLALIGRPINRWDRTHLMTTGMLIILASGAAFGSWAALALMGSERARRLTQIEAQRPIVPKVIASPPATPSP